MGIPKGCRRSGVIGNRVWDLVGRFGVLAVRCSDFLVVCCFGASELWRRGVLEFWWSVILAFR